jgi:hypothetical protein
MDRRLMRQNEYLAVSVGDARPYLTSRLEVLTDEVFNLREGADVLEIDQSEVLAIEATQIGKQFFWYRKISAISPEVEPGCVIPTVSHRHCPCNLPELIPKPAVTAELSIGDHLVIGASRRQSPVSSTPVA